MDMDTDMLGRGAAPEPMCICILMFIQGSPRTEDYYVRRRIRVHVHVRVYRARSTITQRAIAAAHLLLGAAVHGEPRV